MRATRGSGVPRKGWRPARGRMAETEGRGESNWKRSTWTNWPSWRRLERMRSVSGWERRT